MRIITGEFRGRRLVTPKNDDVRPTTDKVKEAVFSMLIPYIDEDSVVLDLFAGTGNLGLEALSRGAEKCYFSDASRESIGYIKENIKICKAEDYSIVLAGDFKSNIHRIKDQLDIVFVDPPYKSDLYMTALEELSKAKIMNPGGCIICEHDSRDVLPEEAFGFKIVKQKTYGSIGVTIYE